MQPGRRYVVISPCRDEAKYMRQTLDSVIAQSIRPARWIIVDDGSTDETPQILAEYRARHNWIEVVTRSDRGRQVGRPRRDRCLLCRIRNDQSRRLRFSVQARSGPAAAAPLLRAADATDGRQSAHCDLQRQGIRRGKRNA